MSDIGGDLLTAPADNLVSIHYVVSALRRRRRLLVGLAAAGLLLGVMLSVAVPKPRSATTALLLQYPTGSDPTRAMATDVSLLQTRAVAAAALKSLGLHESPTAFLSSYHGTSLSDSVLRITVKAPSPAESVRRGNALSRAFLGFREQTYDYQLSVVNDLLQRRVAALQNEVSTLNGQIATVDPNATGANTTSLADLLTQRTAETNDIAQIQSDMQNNVIATTTVVHGSRVIDPASVVPASAVKALLVNGIAGLVAVLALGGGAVTLVAVTSTRLRRRADVATALRAPVLVSVGPVLPPSWLRAVRSRVGGIPWLASLLDGFSSSRHFRQHSDDLKLVARHLQSLLASASTQPPALVVVAIGSVEVADATVRMLVDRLNEESKQIDLVNETGRPLIPAGPAAGEHDDASAAGGAAPAGVRLPTSDGVVIIAVLDPAKGAEHLREWASDAVAVVTAGRSTATTLESNSAMIRAAGLHLRSVVLIGCDTDDDSMGTYDAGPQPKAPARRATAPRKASRARQS